MKEQQKRFEWRANRAGSQAGRRGTATRPAAVSEGEVERADSVKRWKESERCTAFYQV